MTTEAESPQEAQSKPKEIKQFCLGCHKVTKFLLKGCLRVCSICDSVGQIDKG